jgi:acetyltransferase-like isoleucine patch superfamily enzyme
MLKLKNKVRNFLIKLFLPFGQIFLEIIKLSQEKKQNISNTCLLENIPLKGDGIKINGHVNMTHPRNIVLGSNVHIGNNCWFFSLGGIIIGDNVHISRNVTIYTANHNYNGALPYDDSYDLKPVIIKKNSWIGMNVSIVPGVTIGEGCIVGLGAVIAKDIPDFSIVGQPQHRILKKRDKETYMYLEKNKIYGAVNGKIYSPSKKFKKLDSQDKNILFIIGTGRSGTKTLSSLLNSNENIFLKHEISEQLLRISTCFENGLLSRLETKKILKEIYLNSTVFPSMKIIGESNQKLGNLVGLLFEIFPNAKFLWVKRDGRKTISSTYSKGWYKDSDKVSEFYNPKIDKWEDSRLQGDQVGEFTKNEWINMTTFQKNSWYYAYWSFRIKNEFSNIPEKNKLIIDIDNLSNSIKIINAFLGLNNITYDNKIYNKSIHKIYSYDKWNSDEKKFFEYMNNKYL